jgi:hypothetical protein
LGRPSPREMGATFKGVFAGVAAAAMLSCRGASFALLVTFTHLVTRDHKVVWFRFASVRCLPGWRQRRCCPVGVRLVEPFCENLFVQSIRSNGEFAIAKARVCVAGANLSPCSSRLRISSPVITRWFGSGSIGAAEARVGDLLGRRREKGSCYRACLSIWYVASKMVGLHQMIGLQGNQCAIARIDAHSNAGEYESRDNRWTCAQRPDVPAKRNQYHVRRRSPLGWKAKLGRRLQTGKSSLH